MIPSLLITDLSRFQFALTAMFHFMFVPLTLGLTWMLVIMEATYLITGKTVYRDMTQFWGKLLAINFAIGVISGITMEFEFGLNWAYFSRTIGGSFAPILAIEGITAFMLEATMFGLFFFTWNKLSRGAHFIVTFFLALGASLSIVNILAANSWMQHPMYTSFNFTNMSVELSSILGLYLNSLAQIRIGHVAFAGFVVGAIFMMGISAYYILKGRDINFAKRSFAAAVGFGFICALTVFFYGDQNGLQVSEYSPEKMAALEGQWVTQKAPASWFLFTIPVQSQEKNYFTIKIPFALSLIATHSLTGTVEGIKPILQQQRLRIENGIKAYAAMVQLRQNPNNPAMQAQYNKYANDLGFGFLLKRYAPNIVDATPEQINKAALDTIPSVATTFFAFRIMIGIWFILFVLLIFGLIYSLKNTLEQHPWFLRACLYSIPLPFIAAEAGWILAEIGRQPWIVHDMLPTFLGTSSISLTEILTSLIAFILFYSTLYAIELFLMFKFARRGPSSLYTGRYHFEQGSAATPQATS